MGYQSNGWLSKSGKFTQLLKVGHGSNLLTECRPDNGSCDMSQRSDGVPVFRDVPTLSIPSSFSLSCHPSCPPPSEHSIHAHLKFSTLILTLPPCSTRGAQVEPSAPQPSFNARARNNNFFYTPVHFERPATCRVARGTPTLTFCCRAAKISATPYQRQRSPPWPHLPLDKAVLSARPCRPDNMLPNQLSLD